MATPEQSYVVTGGGRGIGRAVVGSVADEAVAERAARTAEALAVDAGPQAEVADVVAWLLSAGSGYVSGAVLPVDGGRAAQGRDPEEG